MQDRRHKTRLAALGCLIALGWAAGCSEKSGDDDDCAAGTERCPCDRNTCNTGLTCLSGVCVVSPGGASGGGNGGAAGSTGKAGSPPAGGSSQTGGSGGSAG